MTDTTDYWITSPHSHHIRTFRATAHVQPLHHIGSQQDCSAWCSAMIGQKIWVTDADGNPHLIGVVTSTNMENVSGF